MKILRLYCAIPFFLLGTGLMRLAFVIDPTILDDDDEEPVHIIATARGRRGR